MQIDRYGLSSSINKRKQQFRVGWREQRRRFAKEIGN